jgi:hypothetical protein
MTFLYQLTFISRPAWRAVISDWKGRSLFYISHIECKIGKIVHLTNTSVSAMTTKHLWLSDAAYMHRPWSGHFTRWLARSWGRMAGRLDLLERCKAVPHGRLHQHLQGRKPTAGSISYERDSVLLNRRTPEGTCTASDGNIRVPWITVHRRYQPPSSFVRLARRA